MKLTLIRDKWTDDATFGTLAVNGIIACQTLEDKDRKLEDGGAKVYGRTCIPRGTYTIIIDYSNHFGRELPHILDVPDFLGIRIHPGNTTGDTDGCILVGRTRMANSIGQSRLAFDHLFIDLETAYAKKEPISIEIL